MIKPLFAVVLSLGLPGSASAYTPERFEAAFDCYEKVGAYTSYGNGDQLFRIPGAFTTTDRRGFTLQAVAVPAPERNGFYLVDAAGAAFYACPEMTPRKPGELCRFRIMLNGTMQYFSQWTNYRGEPAYTISENYFHFTEPGAGAGTDAERERARAFVDGIFTRLEPAQRTLDDRAWEGLNVMILAALRKAGAGFREQSMSMSLSAAYRGAAIYDYLGRLNHCDGMGNVGAVRSEARRQIDMVRGYSDAFPNAPR